jgi:predicted dehydrogenase
MATVDNTFVGRLQFFESRLPTWAKDPAAIGLNQADIDELTARVAEARARYDTLANLRMRVRAETAAQKDANGSMFDFGIDLIQTIRAFAELTDDAGVYAAASIPPIRPRTPTPPPPKPKYLSVTLLPGGALRLHWKGTVARGASFAVYRKIEGEDGFTLLDTVAAKSFDDTSIPVGTGELVYFIQARRGRHRIDSMHIVIRFGSAESLTITTTNAQAA